MTEEMIIFYEFLIVCVVVFFSGWFARIAYMQYKADKQREQEAEDHREEYIKQINRNNLLNSWCAEAKGGVEK
ncbi:MAG: hypothetical protein J6A49_10625 [Clostridia bacterium]|nr:hypothetical protein [Clostridia bacterium]